MALQVRYLNSEVESFDLPRLCRDPDQAFSDAEISLKDDATTTLRRLEIDLGEIVIKRYNTKNIWHSVRRNFQRSRAENCYSMATEFRRRGILVPETLAVVKTRIGPFSGCSWYISRYQDSELLLEYLNRDDWKEPFSRVVSGVMEVFRVMLNNRLSHGDMKATNLLVNDDAIVVLDLDAARRHRSGFFHRIALRKDKRRFLRNWLARPELSAEFEKHLAALGVS